MPSGRKSKIPELKVITGNPGRRPVPDVERPDVGAAVKPAYLERNARASEIYDEMAPRLEVLGTLNSISAPLLARWCCLEAKWERSQTKMTASLISQMRAYETMLGIDPGSPQAMKRKSENESPAAKFLRGRRASEG